MFDKNKKIDNIATIVAVVSVGLSLGILVAWALVSSVGTVSASVTIMTSVPVLALFIEGLKPIAYFGISFAIVFSVLIIVFAFKSIRYVNARSKQRELLLKNSVKIDVDKM